MIKIPDDVIHKTTSIEIKRGEIIKTSLPHVENPHYCIPLNKNTEDNILLFVICTSKLSFYDKNPKYNSDIVRIPAGTFNFFLKETIINCREVHHISRQELLKNFQKGVFTYVDSLPASYIAKIDNIFKKSRTISIKDKKTILGENL